MKMLDGRQTRTDGQKKLAWISLVNPMLICFLDTLTQMLHSHLVTPSPDCLSPFVTALKKFCLSLLKNIHTVDVHTLTHQIVSYILDLVTLWLTLRAQNCCRSCQWLVFPCYFSRQVCYFLPKAQHMGSCLCRGAVTLHSEPLGLLSNAKLSVSTKSLCCCTYWI